VSPGDPNLAKVELIARALGELRSELIFVGGCAAGLLMSGPATPAARVTYDVDLVAQMASLRDYHRMEKELGRLGFARDMAPEAPICRWRYRDIEVDLMPTDPDILGFANCWYPLAVTTAEDVTLPSGMAIRLIAAPLFLATKFEAFADRGNEDLLASHDLEDIVNILDGRPQLVREIERSVPELRAYLAEKAVRLLGLPDFGNYLPGMVVQDETLPDRVATVAARLELIASLDRP
jgi:predicted nucleotidyltransferase